MMGKNNLSVHAQRERIWEERQEWKCLDRLTGGRPDHPPYSKDSGSHGHEAGAKARERILHEHTIVLQ